MIDFITFCHDQGVAYITEGKNCSPGWIQIKCPFCGDYSKHLGFNIERGGFSCWNCGKKKTFEVMLKLSNLSISEIKRKYWKKNGRPVAKKERKERKTKCKKPSGFIEFSKRHLKYLEQRNFNPSKIIKQWNIQAIGPAGRYKHRIYIPVFEDGILMSYTCRDITGKSHERYKACLAKEEAKNIKKCLYGIDKVLQDTIVVVEGCTDVWRLGPGAVATFGVIFTDSQVNRLRKFKKVFIMYDAEAGKEANKLAHAIGAFTDVSIVSLDHGDPGDLKQKEADRIMSSLMNS